MLAMGALSIAYGVRSGFQLAAHSIVFRNAIGTRQLAYADIDSCGLIDFRQPLLVARTP